MRVWITALLRSAPVMILMGTPLIMAFGVMFWLQPAADNFGLTNVTWDYGVALLWALLILIVISFCPITGCERIALIILWITRIGVTLGFMLFSESHYLLDAQFYFLMGIREIAPLDRFTFGDGTSKVIGLAALHNLVIPESYHAMKVTCALLGLVAVYFFYRAACLFLGYRDIRVLYLLGLFPSILFWGSILGKEPIVLLGIALYAFGVIGFFKLRKARYLWLIGLGILLAAFIRIWLALIFLLPLGVFFVIGHQSIMRRILLVLLGGPIFMLGMQSFSERFQLETKQDLIEQTDRVAHSWHGGGSHQELGRFNSISDMVTFLPMGIFTALFRPLPGEVLNPFGLLAGAENALLLGMLLWIIYKGRWRRIMSEPVIAWAVAVVIIWSAIYGFVSYQNLGTAFRFKAQVMPILFLVLIYLANRRQAAFMPQNPKSLLSSWTNR